MEVMMPPADLHFDSTTSNPIPSFPEASSPCCYTSAPSSLHATIPAVPFQWEERPGLPKSVHRSPSNRMPTDGGEAAGKTQADDGVDDDFEFSFQFSRGGPSEDDVHTISADELFQSGRMRPLNTIDDSIFRYRDYKPKVDEETPKADRGRDRTNPHIDGGGRSGGRRRTTRSLPPLGREGATDLIDICDSSASANGRGAASLHGNSIVSNRPTTVATISGYVMDGIKRWGFMNLLLFRSASEGRDSGVRPRFASMASSMLLLDQDAKGGSFRSVGDESLRRATAKSLHGSSRHGASQEMASYVKSRAEANELMRRKTFLPYKQGLLSFNVPLRSFSAGSAPLAGQRYG